MLKVNEIFGPTVQGEGRSVGKRVLFLRLSQCNLYCTWCDTPYTWNWKGTSFTHPQKYDPATEVHQMSDEDILAAFKQRGGATIKSLVISGGEPLLQQKQLLPLLRRIAAAGWWVEVETNGTVPPSPEMLALVSQFNCSPKLSNSGVLEKLRDRPRAMQVLVASPKVFFKFVISGVTDINEVGELVERYNIPPERVYLMPEGITPEALDERRSYVQLLCAGYSFNFSDRLHVVEYGGIRGV